MPPCRDGTRDTGTNLQHPASAQGKEESGEVQTLSKESSQKRSLQTNSTVVGLRCHPLWAAPASPHQPISGLSSMHRAGTPSPKPLIAGIGLNGDKELPTAPSSCTLHVSIPHLHPLGAAQIPNTSPSPTGQRHAAAWAGNDGAQPQGAALGRCPKAPAL